MKKEELFKKYDEIVWKYWKYITYKTCDSYMWNQLFPTTFYLDDELEEKDMLKMYECLDENNMKYLYIHIPFCKSKCSYCYTSSKVWHSIVEYEKYINHLLMEIDRFVSIAWKKLKITSLYIWWGTPNILGTELLNKLLLSIKSNFDLSETKDYCIDLMPYLLTKEMVLGFKRYWVTRCTYAIQSFNEDVLKQNNRFFTKNFNHIEAVWWLKKYNIEVNIDLMIWISWQSMKICIDDLKKSIELKVENISPNYLLNSSWIWKQNNSFNLIYKIKKHIDKYIITKYNKSELYECENSGDYKNYDLIWFWAWSITQLYSKVSYYSRDIDDYYDFISKWNFNFKKVKIMDIRFEMIKYFRLYLYFGIDYTLMNKRFWVDIFKYFKNEMDYLLKNKIIKIKWNKIVSIVPDLKVFNYISIFIVNDIDKIEEKFNLDNYNNTLLYNFFTLDWQKIDWDVDYKDNL